MVLGTLINHPELLSRDTLYELRNVVACYPYFQAARLLMLKNMYLLHDSGFGTELRRSALYISDRRVLSYLVGDFTDRVVLDESGLEEESSVDRTMCLIDAFLGTLPEEQLIFPLASDSVGDYAARFLMNDKPEIELSVEEVTPSSTTSHDDSVERALNFMTHGTNDPDNVSSDTPSDEVFVGEETLDESYFTETLAKIYIKQRKYSRALEIIRSLYLQFPEKNAYFADQIRFLEKLIINNNLK